MKSISPMRVDHSRHLQFSAYFKKDCFSIVPERFLKVETIFSINQRTSYKHTVQYLRSPRPHSHFLLGPFPRHRSLSRRCSLSRRRLSPSHVFLSRVSFSHAFPSPFYSCLGLFPLGPFLPPLSRLGRPFLSVLCLKVELNQRFFIWNLLQLCFCSLFVFVPLVET